MLPFLVAGGPTLLVAELLLSRRWTRSRPSRPSGPCGPSLQERARSPTTPNVRRVAPHVRGPGGGRGGSTGTRGPCKHDVGTGLGSAGPPWLEAVRLQAGVLGAWAGHWWRPLCWVAGSVRMCRPAKGLHSGPGHACPGSRWALPGLAREGAGAAAAGAALRQAWRRAAARVRGCFAVLAAWDDAGRAVGLALCLRAFCTTAHPCSWQPKRKVSHFAGSGNDIPQVSPFAGAVGNLSERVREGGGAATVPGGSACVLLPGRSAAPA